MDAVPSGHPTHKILSSFGLGRLDESLAKAVNNHLERCPACRKQVAELSADSLLGRVRDAQATDKSTDGKSQVYWSQSLEETGAAAPIAANTLPPGLADHPDYEIKHELGRGGMGVVYLAHNKLMGRDEVLKVIGRQIMERPGVLDRFLREIRAVAQLRHPNIVTAYHATRLGESIVFAMEYVAGLDLSRMLKSQGPIPVAHACYFAYQAALGLQHAHEEGLVHRDIKPGNLMLSHRKDKATIKILDFGLAKVTREEKVDVQLTSQGQALGTPDYIAPEQIVDAPKADIRADIYSLGGTLYHLLSGRPPFQADSLYDMYQAHMSRDADSLNLVRPAVPAELAALVSKMMAKDPNRRFQTPGEVALALVPFFKNADGTFKSAKTDVFQSSQSTASQPGRRTVSTPIRPASESRGSPVRAAKTVVEQTLPVAPWQSLIPFRKTESARNATPAVVDSSRRKPPWMWPAIVAASSFGLLMLGVIIFVATDKGRIKIVVNDPRAVVQVDGEAVRIESLGEPITLRAGKHALGIKWADGEFETTTFVVKRGDNEALRVEYEPKSENQADGLPNSGTASTVAVDSKSSPADAAEHVGKEPSQAQLKDVSQSPKATGKPPAPVRLDSPPDHAPQGSVWVGWRIFLPDGLGVQCCELKITSRDGTQFEGEMTLLDLRVTRSFAVKVKGGIAGETVNISSEKKGDFQQNFAGKMSGNEMRLKFSGTTRDGGQAQGEAVLLLKEAEAVEERSPGAPLIRKERLNGNRIVASWFARDDPDGWYTLNEDGTADATKDFKIDSNDATSWLVANDVPNDRLWGWHAPEKFLGNHSDKFGRVLVYRIWTHDSDLPATNEYVRLTSGAMAIFVDGNTLGPPVAKEWKTYITRLDSSGGWKLKRPNGHIAKAKDEDIKQVLSQMTGMWIKGEYEVWKGPESGGCLQHVFFGGGP